MKTKIEQLKVLLNNFGYYYPIFQKDGKCDAVKSRQALTEAATLIAELQNDISDQLIKNKSGITQFLDGSAYMSHVERVRKARGAEVPESYYTIPLMYLAASDVFLGPNDPIPNYPIEWGCDFETELGIVLSEDIPMGTVVKSAAGYTEHIVLINDISLRSLIPEELKKGFGFHHGKPHSTLSHPVPIDLMLDDWHDNRLDVDVIVKYNNEVFGKINAAENMHFSFAELITHAAKTRPLSRGTLIGSGTLSSRDLSDGFGCIVEQRLMKKDAPAPWMTSGSLIEMYVDKYADTLWIQQIMSN